MGPTSVLKRVYPSLSYWLQRLQVPRQSGQIL